MFIQHQKGVPPTIQLLQKILLRIIRHKFVYEHCKKVRTYLLPLKTTAGPFSSPSAIDNITRKTLS